ncbi:hypothetical protein Q5M85_06640 [Paraclostridium bifermentans]|nr:hypothetical protein [Paraclostridium bifermentans]
MANSCYFWVALGIHSCIYKQCYDFRIRQCYDAVLFACTFATSAVVLAIFIKTKDKKLKEMAIPNFISGILELQSQQFTECYYL